MDNKFIEKIKFQEDFAPFSKEQEIEFKGEIEIQNLIEFYLKSKGDKNAKENAKRFKINCVLGNNGGGKSRLFQAMLLKSPYPEDIVKPKITINSYKLQYDTRLFFLDDFFMLSSNINNSINIDLLRGENYNSFYINFYEFLSDRTSIIAIFLNVNTSFNLLIGINGIAFNLNLVLEKETRKDIILDEIFNTYSKIFELFKSKYGETFDGKKTSLLDSFFLIIYKEYSELAFELIQNYIDFKNSIDSANSDKEYIFLGEIKNFYDNYFNDLSDLSISYLKLTRNFELQESISNLYDELTDFLLLFENSDGLISGKFTDSINKYKTLKAEHDIFFNTKINLLNLKTSFYEFTFAEAKVLGRLFQLDIGIGTEGKVLKTFNSLSSGEKVVLPRFINIYYKIINEFKNGSYKNNDGVKKLDFTILIDEPDIHLHLDWQRQYIQRLIDVFSTLPQDIKIHFIIATHSPFIISDLPAESLVLLENGKEKKYEGKTFGANYIDLIQNGFFFKDQTLMGSFAEEIIGKMAVEERENIIKEEFKENPLKDLIGDDFLKDNLLYFKNKKYD